MDHVYLCCINCNILCEYGNLVSYSLLIISLLVYPWSLCSLVSLCTCILRWTTLFSLIVYRWNFGVSLHILFQFHYFYPYRGLCDSRPYCWMLKNVIFQFCFVMIRSYRGNHIFPKNNLIIKEEKCATESFTWHGWKSHWIQSLGFCQSSKDHRRW